MSRPLDHPRRCQAHSSRTGAACKKWALRGMTVCATHGGHAPQTRAAAEQRIARLATGPAIDALAKALRCGEWSAVVRSARDLLDRHERRQQQFDPQTILLMVRDFTALALSLARDDADRMRVATVLRRWRNGVVSDLPALPPAPGEAEGPSDDVPVHMDLLL